MCETLGHFCKMLYTRQKLILLKYCWNLGEFVCFYSYKSTDMSGLTPHMPVRGLHRLRERN